ncbi:MAG TPA: PH domain-containing protein [Xanthobacteraceae bacterium]|nr:PH domain-containing protein [Xanthobacteraceae bacterium]
MPYVDSVLQPGEIVRHRATIHWVVYLRGAVLLILSFFIWLLTPAEGALHTVGIWLALFLLAMGVYFLLRAWLRRWMTEYAVTDRRVIYKQGLIWRKTMEVNMDKVSSVDVDQSIFGRLFNYGTVKIHSPGADPEPIREVGSPLDFRNHITAA